jgi:hypothetical protein
LTAASSISSHHGGATGEAAAAGAGAAAAAGAGEGTADRNNDYDFDDNGSMMSMETGSVVGDLPSLTINTGYRGPSVSGPALAPLLGGSLEHTSKLDRLFADALDVNAEDSVDEFGIRMVHNYSVAPTPKSEWGTGTSGFGSSFKHEGTTNDRHET